MLPISWYVVLGLFLAEIAVGQWVWGDSTGLGFPSPATTTTAPPAPTAAQLKAMIVNGAGNRIDRAYNYAGIHHQYRFGTFAWADAVAGYRNEGKFGFAVSPSTYAKIKFHCPELRKATLSQKQGYPRMSRFTTGGQLAGFSVLNTFYCAPRKGYCGGANNELVEIRSKVGPGDNFYPWTLMEQQTVLRTNSFYHNNINRRICWIWRY